MPSIIGGAESTEIVAHKKSKGSGHVIASSGWEMVGIEDMYFLGDDHVNTDVLSRIMKFCDEYDFVV